MARARGRSPDFERLTALLPPPGLVPAPADWDGVEEWLGVPLPADWKAFADRYGAGQVNDFLWTVHPAPVNRYLSLPHLVDTELAALRSIRDGEWEMPYPLHPEPGGVLPWAISDNGDVLHWLTGDPDPDRWTVVVSEARGPEWDAYPGGACAALAAFLTGEWTVSLFPDDVPGDYHRFVSYHDRPAPPTIWD